MLVIEDRAVDEEEVEEDVDVEVDFKKRLNEVLPLPITTVEASPMYQ